MYRAITAGLKIASSSDDIRSVLLTGAGDCFCAGNDLDAFLSIDASETSSLDFMHTIAAFDKPLVAAVQGLAVGIGTTMLFHCDLVYASPDASFLMPFVTLGLVPEAASSLIAPAALGMGRAARMLLLAEPLSAQEAEAAGFVAGVVPEDQLLDHAREKTARLAKLPSRALAVTRRLLKSSQAAAVRARMDEENALFAEALTSPEAREIIAGFFARR
jgi:enoyl-CoA hydratase/carnithine racemase